MQCKWAGSWPKRKYRNIINKLRRGAVSEVAAMLQLSIGNGDDDLSTPSHASLMTHKESWTTNTEKKINQELTKTVLNCVNQFYSFLEI